MPSVAEMFGHQEEINDLLETSSPDMVSDTKIGIEIELNRATRFTSKYWDEHQDGSLRDNGREYVFKVPLWGEDVIAALNELELFYDRPGFRPLTDNDTSVHCHVDVRNMDMPELVCFIQLYIIFEHVLYAEYAPERARNVFSWPVSEAPSLLLALSDLYECLLSGNSALARHSSNILDRYFSINLVSLNKFGSIEFRAHGGCYKSSPILAWVNALLQLQKRAIEFVRANNTALKPYLMFKDRGPQAGFEYFSQGIIPFKSEYIPLLQTGLRTAKLAANGSKLDYFHLIRNNGEDS